MHEIVDVWHETSLQLRAPLMPSTSMTAHLDQRLCRGLDNLKSLRLAGYLTPKEDILLDRFLGKLLRCTKS
jgi:hypothetical protein